MSSVVHAKTGRHLNAARHRRPWWRPYFLLPSVVTLLSVGAGVMCIVALCTGFRMRRLYAEVIGRSLGRAALWICGVRLRIHGPNPESETQTIFLANHTSTLDAFILLALGLPRARFFLKGKYRLVPPLAVIGYLLGVFFTPPQTDRSKRVRCFQRAERVLRRTGDSVFLSPEGTRITTGEIGVFNKGAFHLATNLHAPIVPIFIAIPRNINPGRGFAAMPGVVDVYFQPPIATREWKIEDLDKNRAAVRNCFTDLNARLRAR